MLDDLDDILGNARRPLDWPKIDSLIDSATKLASTDPIRGLSSLLSTGSLIDSSMASIAGLIADLDIPKVDLPSSLSSLGKLKVPYETLTGLEVAEPYRGTISSLASVAEVADSIAALTLPDLDSLASEGLFPTSSLFSDYIADELGTAHALTSPYLASAASLYSLESSYAALLGSASDKNILSGLSLDSVDYLQDSVVSLSLAVQNAWGVLGKDTSIWDRVSLSMLQTPALELYIGVQAAGAVTLVDEKLPDRSEDLEDSILEKVNGFEARLVSFDRGLVEPYRGAIAAIERGGADWQRHSMISLRELTMHVLHKLAPAKEIMKSASEGDLHNGRPTRRARLQYIFAAVSGPELADFFEADLKAAIELFDLINSGTHRLNNIATPQQLHYLRSRVVGLISSMLETQGY